MPKMMLGTAASSSTATPIGRLQQRRTQFGQEQGDAESGGNRQAMAITEVTTVP